MNESAANIKFMECRMKGHKEKFVMQMEYPQCLFQVHEFESTQHYLDTLHQSKSWVHTQVGCRNMALTFNGCMMFYEFGQDDASEKAKKIIDTLNEAARWYDEFLKDTQTDSQNLDE